MDETERHRDLMQQYKLTPDFRLRNQLIEAYMPIVQFFAGRITNSLVKGNIQSILEYGDLVDVGVFGLMDSIDAFQYEGGATFRTFCQKRVSGAMLDELRETDVAPRSIRSDWKWIGKTRDDLRQKLGYDPSSVEMTEELGLKPEEYVTLEYKAESCKWLNLNNSEASRIVDSNCLDSDEKLQKLDALRLVTKGCNQRERLIMIGFYYEGQTMKEIGDSLGISESRVSQLHSALIPRLQKQLNGREEEFFPAIAV